MVAAVTTDRARRAARPGLLTVAAGAALSTVIEAVGHLLHRSVPAHLLALGLALLFAGLVVALVGAMTQLVGEPATRHPAD